MRRRNLEARRALAPGGAQQQHEREADGGDLLDHHHDPGELLVGERREAEQAHGLVDVGREERPEVEQDHVGHDLPRAEDERRVADAARSG